MQCIRHESKQLKILLDPPRSGTAEGVIEYIASQNPEKVVHIFCNSEIIEKELGRWKKSGYIPDTTVPFDMFPGTNEIEIMVINKVESNFILLLLIYVKERFFSIRRENGVKVSKFLKEILFRYNYKCGGIK